MRDESRVENGIERVLVDKEILPQHFVRMEPVADAPILHLRWTCKIHWLNGSW